MQGMSDGIYSRINSKRERWICCDYIFCAQATAVAILITKHILVCIKTIVLVFGSIDKIIETRYCLYWLRHANYSSNIFDSLCLGEPLVQGPAFSSYPHLICDIQLYCWLNESFSSHFRGKNNNDIYPLCLYLFEYLRIIWIVIEAFGVCQADLSVLNPLYEQFPSIDAKIIIDVKESNPAPVEVLQNVKNHLYGVCIGMHCSQKRGVFSFYWKDRTRWSIVDLQIEW